MEKEQITNILEFSKLLKIIRNYCVTDPGREAMQELQPWAALSDAVQEGIFTTEAIHLLNLLNDPPIENMADIRPILSVSGIDGSILDGKQINAVRQVLNVSSALRSFLSSRSGTAPGLANFGFYFFTDRVLEKNINATLEDDGSIKETASKVIREIRKEISERQLELHKIAEKMVGSLNERGLLREDYFTIREGRVVLPVKAEYKRSVKGFIHAESATGQTVYIEPEETLQLNNEIVSLMFAEKRETDRILRELTSQIGRYREQIVQSFEYLLKLDLIFAKAKYAREFQCFYPAIEQNGNRLKVTGARHPLLLNRLGRDKTVPFALELNSGSTLIISGPNAGGKTVILKSLGLFYLMVMSGIPIPADEGSIWYPFENLFIEIGDNQSLEDDLSAFSSHLSNLKSIFDSAGRNDLVLLDELGNGTEPATGAAIAAEYLITLKKRNVTVVATTHFGDLKLLPEQFDGMSNASMEFNTEQLRPVFKLRQGIPGVSYAFEIASRIGFSELFINGARGFLSDKSEALERALMKIEGLTSELLHQKEEQESLNRKYLALVKETEDRLNKVKEEEVTRRRKIREEANTTIASLRQFVKATKKELKQEDKNSALNKSQNAIREIETTLSELELEESPVSRGDYRPKEGDYVKIDGNGSAGQIEVIDTSKQEATIAFGSLKMQVKLNRLVPSAGKEVKKEAKSVSVMNDVPYRYDIRGKKPEEIKFELERLLDSSYVSGVNRLEILHGKGTGVLKSFVKQTLTGHPGIANFYYAPVEVGGEGVTIVEFRES